MRHNVAGDTFDCTDAALPCCGCLTGYSQRSPDLRSRQRASGYAASKARVETEEGGADAARVLDYSHFPLAVWRLSSPAALNRLESNPAVRTVHENILLHPVSVSDLGSSTNHRRGARRKGCGDHHCRHRWRARQ
jgi:hypothetical protein